MKTQTCNPNYTVRPKIVSLHLKLNKPVVILAYYADKNVNVYYALINTVFIYVNV